MNDKRDQLYDNLINSGKVSEAEIGNRDEFKAAISDEAKTRQFYQNIIGSKLLTEDEIGSEDDFFGSISSDFAPSPGSGSTKQPMLDAMKERKPSAQPQPAAAPSPSKGGKQGGFQPTWQDSMRYGQTIDNAGYVAGASLSSYEKKASNLQKRQGLNVPKRVNVGETNNLVEGEQHLNPETGELKQGYITSAGNEYDSKAGAEAEQRQIDDYDRKFRYATGKGMDELSDRFVAPLVDEAMKKADEEWFVSMGEGMAVPMGEGMELHRLRNANKKTDPERILQGLQKSLERVYENPEMQKEISRLADSIGMSRDEYLEQVVAPSLAARLENKFASSQIAKNMPKNATEYILQGLGDSIGGMLMNAATETKSQRDYKNQAEALTEQGENPYYNPGTGAKLSRMGISFAADAPFFGIYGRVSGQVAKKIAERQIGKMVAKGLSENAARSIVGTALENSVGARMKNYLMQHVVSSSLTLGGYNATSELARQVRDKEGIDIGKIAGSTAEGLATGAAFGVTGGVSQALSQPLSGIRKVGAKLAGFGAEAETMYATEELAKMAHGQEGFTDPFEGSLEAIEKLGVMKLSSPGGLTKAFSEIAHPVKSNQRQRSGVNFTPEEQEYIRNSAEGRNLVEALSNMHPDIAISEVNGKKRLTPEGEQMRRALSDSYNSFMENKETPAVVKQKVAAVLGGIYRPGLETGADIIHNSDGSVILKTRDREGNCIQDIKFDSFSDADAWREEHTAEFRLNDAVNGWNGTAEENRRTAVTEIADAYGISWQEAKDMVYKALDIKDTSLDGDQYNMIFDIINRNAYPEDEYNPKRRYEEGKQTSPEERHLVQVNAQLAEEALRLQGDAFAEDVIAAAEYPDEKIAELASTDGVTKEQIEAARDYYNAASRLAGMMDETLKGIDERVEAANAEVRRYTHPDSGALVSGMYDGGDYYVTAGHFQITPEGRLQPTDNSGMVILRDKATGEIKVVNPNQVTVTAVEDPTRVIEFNESNEGLRGQLMKQADDSIELHPDTPEVPQEAGEIFRGADGKTYMVNVVPDETGNMVWTKVEVELDEGGNPANIKGEPQPLDIDEYRKAKSNEIDEASRPHEEVTEPQLEAEPAAVPPAEAPADNPVPEKTEIEKELERRLNGGINMAVDDSQQATAASRIPVNDKGKKIYEQAKPEDTLAELTERYGEVKAQQMIVKMAENTARAYEELSKKDTSKITDMADLTAHEDALAEAERKAAYWQQFMKKEEPKAEQPATEQPPAEEAKVDEPAIEQPAAEPVPPVAESPAQEPYTETPPPPELHQEPVQPQQPQTQPPVQPQQPTGQEKIYRGSTEANVGRTFTFTNSAGVRSELTIQRVDADGNALVSRRDYDAQGNPMGEAREESYAATKVGEAIVSGTWKQVKSVEERLREAYKGRIGIQNIIDVLTEPEMERMLAAHERGDKEALRDMQNEFVETHREDIILKTRDKRNQIVSGILSGGFSIGEKLRRIRKQFQGYDDAEMMLSDEALQPGTLEEYVADLHSSVPKQGEGPIAYFSYEKDGMKVVGMQDETGHGTKTGGDTKGYAPWLAPKGKGMSLQKYAENIHSQLPEGIKEQYTDQDVRNAILEVFGGAERPSDIPTMIIRRGVLQAEQAARRMEEMWIDGVSYQKKPKSFAERLQRGIEQTSQEPTDAQKEAGNYAKGHVTFGGYHFTIENPAGSVRRGTDESGKQWEQQMHNTYGYILGRYGKDGDHLDMFINDAADLDNWNGPVFVVDQVKPDGTFDEHKIVYGYDSVEEARKAYLSNYEEGWQGLGNITGVSKEKFDGWLDSSKRKMKPFAEHSIGREASVEDVRERILQEQERQKAASRRETVLRDALVEHLQGSGLSVVTDAEEGQRVLDEFNGRLTDDVKQMGTSTRKRQSEIAKTFTDTELSNEQRQIVDVFSGNVDKTSVKLTDKSDKERNIVFRQGNERKAGVKHSVFRHYHTDANGFTSEEVAMIPDIIANGDRKQDKGVRVSYRYEKDGIAYTVTTEVKGKDELFTNFYTNRKPYAVEQGTSNTENRHVQPQQTASDAKVQQNSETAKDSERKFFKTPDGQAYGYTYQGKIYIDPRIATSETPIHEYGHLWTEMKRQSAPEEWAEIKQAILNDKLIEPVLRKVRDEYPELEGREDDFVEEVLTQFSGKRGAERLREVAEQVAQENGGVFGKAEAVTAMQRLKNVLNRFWESVARMLGVKYRNANDIADMMMKDFLNGVNPRQRMKDGADRLSEMRAYHGSAAEFDRFDHTKVGSGEGQAVSGYGTYVTTSEGTARYYANVASTRQRKVIRPMGYTVDGEVVRDPALVRAYDYLKKADGDVGEAIKACEHTIEVLNRHKDKNPFGRLGNGKSTAEEAMDYLLKEKEKPGTIGFQEEIVEQPDRQLYEVEIPDDTGKNYFDLDKKLTKKQKADIKKRFLEALDSSDEADYWKKNRDIIEYDWKQVDSSDGTGDAARGVMEQFLPSEKVSEIFSDMGYVGSKVKGSDGTTYIIYNADSLQIKDRMRFQMMGRHGAAEADKAEGTTTRQDNMSVAEDMEKAGKDAKAIKLATGWERGTDGQWRYEIPDADANILSKYKAKADEMKADGVESPEPILKLGELLGEDNELFRYYPKMKDMPVLFSRGLPVGTAGAYDRGAIELNIKELNRFEGDDLNNENVYGTLLHEVQHVIQEKEGFALGGNLQTSTTEDGINAIIEKKERQRADIKTRLDANNKILSDPENLKMSAELEGKTEKEVRDQLTETVDQQAAEYETLGLQIDRLRHAKAPSMTDAKDLYHRLAGEVESRNVTERMGMTGEQRRQSLASETEDVPREEQVIINGKETENNSLKFQKVEGISSEEGPKLQKVGGPEPEMTPEERQYWNKWDAAMKKWKERNAIPADQTQAPDKPKYQQGETALSYAQKLVDWNRQKSLWQTAPKIEDYRQVRDDKAVADEAHEAEKRYPDSEHSRRWRIATDLARIRHAMSRQKAYDKATVKAVTDFAHDFMTMGFGDNLSRGEMERMLSSVKNATGAKDIKKHVDNIMNILIDNQLRNLDQQVVKLSSTKELRQTAQGVERQGKLELKGQKMIQKFREARETRMTAEDIRTRMAEVMENIVKHPDSDDMWEQEYEGLSIALQYAENIDGSRQEFKALDDEYKDAVKGYKESGRSKAQQELLESLDQAMMENKIERIGSFGDIIGRLEGNIAVSMEGAREFLERDKQRVKHIHDMANFDLAGKDMRAHRKDTKGKPANFFLQPLGTFEQMLKQFGARNANGEGYLYDYFMRNWMDATDNAYLGEVQAKEELDTKAREVFGGKVKRWSDLYRIVMGLPTMDVEVADQGEPKTFTLTQGNLLYIYMADKMNDGRMKLRKMGIDEETVEKVKKFLDPRLVQLGDWLQDEYLPGKRVAYNKVHERMFGAPMAAIDHYFPIKILGDARVQVQDVNVPDAEALPSTITGNIIKRRRNTLPLDILHTDALSLAIEHVEDMERWAAQAEWNRDVNTLLSYTTFRNKVKNMDTIYGSGDALWNTFKDAAKMAAGTYNPSAKSGHIDKAISNIAKGVTAAKISFRVYTAFKQILSAPAFLHDVDLGKFVKDSVNPYGSWKWAMENMPVFRKRWESRQMGDTRLMDDPTDWKMWKNNLVQMATMLGMSPNALVDGITCAVGARSIYESRLRKYKQIGASDEVARKRALQDAEIGYNLTQQSSEGAFVSAIQKDRTVAANMLSVFRNSSMAYTRQWVDAARNLRKRAQKGYKEDSIKFMARQMQEQFGIDEDQAKRAAELEYARAGRHDIARMLNMMFGVTVAWNLGASLPYLLIGDDDDTKKEMMTDALVKGLLAGPVEGLAAGNIVSDMVGRMTSEQTRKAIDGDGWGAGLDAALKQGGDYEVNPLPLMADIQSMIKKLGYDKYAAAQDVFNICVQSAVGVNPQTFTDMWNACMDYGAPAWDGTSYTWGKDNLARPKEIALFIMRLMNAPTSSWRNKYIDELGMDVEDAKKLSYDEMARRYAHYKHWKDAPIMGWLRGEEGRQEKMAKIRKQFDKAVQERIGRLDYEELRENLAQTEDESEKKLILKEMKSQAGMLSNKDILKEQTAAGSDEERKMLSQAVAKRVKEEMSGYSDRQLADSIDGASSTDRKNAFAGEFARRQGSQDYGGRKNASREYQRLRTYEDIKEDLTMAEMYAKVKESLSEKDRKRVERLKRQISGQKNKGLDGPVDEDAKTEMLSDIRSWRRECLEILMRADNSDNDDKQ